MKGIIRAVETPEGKFMVGYDDNFYEAINQKLPFYNRGSYNVLPARLLGISYAEYLRYARDKYNGIIYGKGHKFPIVKFDNKQDCNLLCKELLLRWTRV